MVGSDLKSLSRDELEAEILRLREVQAGGAAEAFGRRVLTTPGGRDELFAAVEKTRTPMILTDPNRPDDPIVFANRAFQDLSGYGADELLGRNCRFLQGPDTDPAHVQAIRDALAAKRDLAIDIVNYRRDGTPFLNELFISPILDPEGRVLYHFGSQVDVTGYRQTMSRLAENERRQRAVFDSAVDFAIVVTDCDGLVTDWNAGAERVFGWTAGEMRGQPADRFFTPEDRAAGRIEAEMRRARDEGRAPDERWHLRKDGSRFWASGEMMPLLDEVGKHFGFTKIARDRTAEHEAGRALRESEARLGESEDHFRHTVELNPQVPWTCDPAGNITSYSNRWLELTGQAPGEPDGAGWMRALHPDDVPHTVAVFSASLSSGEPVDVDYRINIAGSGEYRWMRARAQARRDGAGSIVRWYGVVEDINDRRLAEEALRRSETRYRTLFETIEVGFCILRLRFDADGRAVDYLIEEANPAFARQTGADLAGRWVSTFAPGLERHWFDIYGRVARTGEPARFENYASVFGRWFDVRAHRVGEPGDHRVAVFFNDITARRNAELLAETNERELRLIADALPVLIAFIDAGHVYRFANEAYVDWFFVPPGEVVGRDVRRLLGPAGYAARKDFIDRALGGESVLFELDWPHRDGRPRVAEIRYLPRRDAGGAVDGFHVFVQDVTDRHRAEALLRSEKSELEAQVAARTAERDEIWRVSSDLLCVATLDGHFTSLNPAWRTTLGWSEDELRGKPFLDFVHPDDHASTRTAAAGLVRGEAQLSFENRYRHRDGSYRWLSWNAVPRGGLVYSAVRDVTEAKAAAEALAKTEEALRQSQKMEAVGQLTGGLAHDFNNMLAGIVGSLELMQTRMLQGRMSDMERYIGAAQGAAKRAAALTHRLLAFSRRQTLDPKPTDVNRLVEGMVDLVRRTVGPAVPVEFVGMGGVWPTLVDPSQLENALLNLCINARDAMPDGGRITIETGNRWLDERGARERDLSPGQYVALCVSDTGTGMTPDVVAKAFDPFFTTKPLGEGTGLGLSMIYGFAKQSGGQVRIYSEVGQGTMVCVYLPRHLGEAEDADAVADLSEAARAKAGETVLVVDDEPTVRMLVTEVLEDLGYAAIEAGDGASGLKVLQSDVRIDLLVTDVGLPGGLNGRQMADAARQHRPDLKVLFITGYAENAVLNHGHLAHGMNVMTKPFALEALATRIRGIIEGQG
ncbi:PAS domain S-box protein [Methylobacterium sp. E-046]|uniref:PAS domain S-box protein n=1 Tax=Methylobacterium sp. E-046 TaxID=2836576 RepID=UPI001FBC0199|nr:PAS domain S-box protein [Methylobacterium sp. E-046]MCJ2099785.1 PAS domain S-box protein [Methylobacterium sp. E-046]